MNAVDAVVTKVGGRRALAAALGVTEQAVGQWAARGWVPPARAAQLVELYGGPLRDLLKPELADAIFPSS